MAGKNRTRRIVILLVSGIVPLAILMIGMGVAAATGILTNSDFTTNTSGWTCIKSNGGSGTVPTNCDWQSDGGVGAGVSKSDSGLRQTVWFEPGVYTIEARGRAVTQGRSDPLCNIKSYIRVDLPTDTFLYFGTQNYSYHTKSATFTVTTAITGYVWFRGNNAGICNNISHVDYIHLSVYSPPEPPPSSPYTTTVPITATCVATINGNTVDLSANLLANASFEDSSNGVTPDSWTFRSPLYAPELYIENDEAGAADGAAYLSQPVMPGNSINQDVYLPSSPEFVVGVLVSNTKAFDGAWGVGVADQVVAGAGGVTSGYQADEGIVSFGEEVYSDTVFSLILLDSLDPGHLNLDVAYLIPISDTGEGYTIYCPAVEEHCEATDCTGTPTTGGTGGAGPGYPVGGGGNSAQCRTCPRPSSWLAIGEWLGYLSCIVVSLFTCQLRVWIWEVMNGFFWVVGSFTIVINVVNGAIGGWGGWLAALLGNGWGAVLASLDVLWIVLSYLTPGGALGLSALINLGQAAFDFFAELYGFILRFWGFVSLLWPLVLDYTNLLLLTIQSMASALVAPPLELGEFLSTYYPEGNAVNTEYVTGAPSESTILMVIFWGLFLMDGVVVDYGLWPIMWAVQGGIGGYTLYWLVMEWRNVFRYVQF